MTTATKSTSNGSQATRSSRDRKPPQRETLGTWAFDSVGPKKYALQLQKASNGNPCLRIVEGREQKDGSYKKFDLTIWSEDFEKFFEAFDALRNHIAEHNVRTPDGHKYTPAKNGQRRGGGGRRGS